MVRHGQETVGRPKEGARVVWAYLEGALVSEHVSTCGPTARLAEEQQLLKEENTTQGLVAPSTHHELILPHQLPLLLEVNLQSWGPVDDWPLLPSSSTPTGHSTVAWNDSHHSPGWHP